jgi:hypothetical protein
MLGVSGGEESERKRCFAGKGDGVGIRGHEMQYSQATYLHSQSIKSTSVILVALTIKLPEDEGARKGQKHNGREGRVQKITLTVEPPIYILNWSKMVVLIAKST